MDSTVSFLYYGAFAASPHRFSSADASGLLSVLPFLPSVSLSQQPGMLVRAIAEGGDIWPGLGCSRGALYCTVTVRCG